VSGSLQGADLFGQPSGKTVPFSFEIEQALQVHPELRLHPEEGAEPERRIGRHAPGPVDDLVDAPGRNVDVVGKAILTDCHRLQKIFEQDLAGVDRGDFLPCHGGISSVVVGDLDVKRMTIPPDEAYSPLVVDANAVLAETVSFQCFQLVRRGDRQRRPLVMSGMVRPQNPGIL
jgi:hypothetical protein